MTNSSLLPRLSLLRAELAAVGANTFLASSPKTAGISVVSQDRLVGC